MIAKLFKRFSVYSALFSLSLLCLLSYLYSIPEMHAFAFTTRMFNFFAIFVLLTITLNSLRRIFKHSKIEKRSHYYLFLYPIILFSFPVDHFDIRILASSTLFFAGWASFREHIASKNSLSSSSSITKLFDTTILVSFSSVIYFENIFLLLFPLLALIFSKKNISRQELGVIFIVPLLILFTFRQLILAFELELFFFLSIIEEYNFSFLNTYNSSFFYAKPDMLIIFILFILSALIGIRNKSDYDSKTLDYDGLIYCLIIFLFIGFSNSLSNMLLYYMSLPLTYYINAIFVLNKKAILANFLIILLTINFLLFNFA